MSTSPFGQRSTAEEVATALQDSIRGKNVLIVAASLGGLGGEFLRVITPYASKVWVAGRTEAKSRASMDAALAGIPTGAHKANLEFLQVDMSSLDSVRTAAAKLNASNEPVHVTIFNQMISQHADLTLSSEGFEAQFSGNHLATFLFTSLIIPRIRQAGPGARVVTIASEAHRFVPFRWDDPNFKLRPEEYHFNQAYALSKLANVFFTQELAKRLVPEGILAFTLHPGFIPTNGLMNMSDEKWAAFAKFGISKDAEGKVVYAADFPFVAKDIPQGVSTHVVAAFDPSIKDQSGAYLTDCVPHNDLLGKTVTETKGGPEKLWIMSEELLATRFL